MNEVNRYESKAQALAKKVFGIMRNNADLTSWVDRLLFLSAMIRAYLFVAEDRHIGLSPQVNWIREQMNEAYRICFRSVSGLPGPLTVELMKAKWEGMAKASIRAMSQDITRYNAREVGNVELMQEDPEQTGFRAEHGEVDRCFTKLSFWEEAAPLTFQHAVFKGVLAALRKAYKQNINLWKVFYYGPKKGLVSGRLEPVKGLAWLQRARIQGHLSGPQYRGLMNIIQVYSPAKKDMPESREVSELDAKEAEAIGLGEKVDMELAHLSAPDLNPEEMYMSLQEGSFEE